MLDSRYNNCQAVRLPILGVCAARQTNIVLHADKRIYVFWMTYGYTDDNATF
jgi:hypothetical protein